MAPNKLHQKSAREEFAGTRVKQKPARRLSGRMPRRVVETGDSSLPAASHGDEPSIETDAPPPREDRAG